MKVTDAIIRRMSVRAFRPEAPPAATVRGILETAARAPSGGNLQPWRVHALTGNPLAELLAKVAAAPLQAKPEYAVYPPNLWEPYRTRRFENGEQLYATLSEDEAFLRDKGLALEIRRYTVSLHHDDYLIDAYFEAGTINVRAGDKRTASTPTAAPRKAKLVNTVEEALDVMAQYLADETN